MGKDIPQVAVFDTGFHQTMPDYAYMYALPYEYYEKYKIRRYGFHGTSHRYVSMRAAAFLGKDPKDLKIITCHLGNGSSIAAVNGGDREVL
jgi:acetate kinase